jgi:hypothetical protein
MSENPPDWETMAAAGITQADAYRSEMAKIIKGVRKMKRITLRTINALGSFDGSQSGGTSDPGLDAIIGELTAAHVLAKELEQRLSRYLPNADPPTD